MEMFDPLGSIMLLRYRIVCGVAIFALLGFYDRWKHPEDPRRTKEYLFLVLATGAAVCYGILNDLITSVLSPEYFRYGKGLAGEGYGFTRQVVILAIKASYGFGLLIGASYLMLNNPKQNVPQLSYSRLFRALLWPLCGAVLLAVCCGVGGAFIHFFADLPRGMSNVRLIHMGSYAGALLGAIAGGITIYRQRRGK